MIPRYAPVDATALFTERHRFATMLEVEILVAEAMAELGTVPSEAAAYLRAHAPQIDDAFVLEIAEREAITNHDTAAFVDVAQKHIGGEHAQWLHYGLTSNDVVDTALSVILRDALNLVIESAVELRDAFTDRAYATIDLFCAGRTHGMYAEPTSFGIKFALWALAADRDRVRLEAARDALAVGKLSGAVGTYSNIDPRVEEIVCQQLGLRPLPSTQVIARDAHAQAFNAIAQFGGTIEQFALEVRLLSRSDVGEMSEFFAEGQKGSSAMPHKRNPIMSERLCGMSRVLRGYAATGMENVALWHERDISHSSAERIIFPDAISLVLYMARRACVLVNTVVIHSDRAMKNLLEDSHGSVFSQSLLLALISMGEERELAYRTVQELSARAVETNSTLQELAYELDLPEATYDQVFSLNRLLAHRERFLSALTWRA